MGISRITLSVLAVVLAASFAKLFVGYEIELYQLTKHAFRVFSLSFLLAGFNIFSSSFFTALNNGAISAAISFLRTLIFQTASVLILPLFFDVDGIWWAITAAEVFACIISASFILQNEKSITICKESHRAPVAFFFISGRLYLCQKNLLRACLRHRRFQDLFRFYVHCTE